jgi:hypothetical protein
MMSSARPPFVLIHGAWYNAATWRAVVPLLETRGYMARALDLPGTGANAKLPISYQHRPLDAKAFATEPSPNTATQQQCTRAITSLVHEVAGGGHAPGEPRQARAARPRLPQQAAAIQLTFSTSHPRLFPQPPEESVT